MKKNPKGKAIILLVFLLLLVNTTPSTSEAVDNSPLSSSISSLTPHAPIRIFNDNNFTDFGFPGYGNESHPYIIEGYEITTSEDYAIQVVGTSKHFVIRNCSFDSLLYGVRISSVSNNTATIHNNTCINSEYGIYISSTDNVIISNNTCSLNDRSIYLSDSNASVIANNTCVDPAWKYGIYLDNKSPSIIVNNSLINCGFSIDGNTIEECTMYAFENNTVNGKKLGYFCNVASFNISDPIYGQILLAYCSNITVENQILDNTRWGISIGYSNLTRLINNTCRYNHNGISFRGTPSAVLENNTCNNNENCGITVSVSENSEVINNTCKYNGRGLYLTGSHNSIIKNNTFSYNGRGIHQLSFDCHIIYNHFRSNTGYAIDIQFGDGNTIHHNTFIDNNLGGTSQANDDRNSNVWYDTSTNEGNHWNDWSGTGVYNIDGSARSVDLYPLDEEGNPPVIPEFKSIPNIILLSCIIFFVIIVRRNIKNRKILE